MFRSIDPIHDHLTELIGNHTGVCGDHQLWDPFWHFGDGSHVAPEQRSKRFFVPPFRMLWQECFQSISNKEHLEVDWLLSPERAIIVERRDPLFWLNEIGRAFLCYSLD